MIEVIKGLLKPRKIKYEVRKDPSAEEPVIVKTGHASEFKMSEVKSGMEKLAKVRKAIESQRDLEDAKMKNILEHSEGLETIEDEKLNAASLYWESKKLRNECCVKLEEVKKVEEEYAADLAEIKKQTGLEICQTETKTENS